MDSLFGGLFGIFMVLWLVGLVVTIWALVDAIRVPDDSMYRSGNKLVWVLVIVFLNWIGAIIYFAIGRPASDATPPDPPTHSVPPAAPNGGAPPLPPPPGS